MTQDVGVASFVATLAAWLFFGGLLLVAVLLFTGRGRVDAAAADFGDEHDTQPLPTIEEAA